jgi:glycosyltransferase involved in cell wall biosynthesis
MVNGPKIALIHDWLVEFGGAEQVLAALLEIWPQAPIYTMIYDPKGQCASVITGHEVHTSFVQKLPGAQRRHRLYLPIMPLAVEQLDLDAFDILLSCSYAVAKGIRTHPEQLHLCYLFTPIRYAWDLQGQYLRESNMERGLRGTAARLILHYIRLWDLASSTRVDAFMAISHYIAQRAWKTYRRRATVIYPPVDTVAFKPTGQKEDFYLTVSRLVPYKKIDIIVEAFSQMNDKELVVIGDGPEMKRLKALARDNVTLMGYQPAEIIQDRMQRARAFVFAALEDFGIVTIEAQACGTPVIAYGRGGSLETVIEGKTGLFFEEQKPSSVIDAVRQFEQTSRAFSPEEARSNAERFSKERFQSEVQAFVEQKWSRFCERRRG